MRTGKSDPLKSGKSGIIRKPGIDSGFFQPIIAIVQAEGVSLMGIIKLKTICWISVLFVCINIAVFPTGGRPEEPVATEKTEGMYGLPLVKERVTIDYFMANHKTKPFTANDLTIAELQRRTNVYFNIISIDSGYWDKYKVMLASNNLPDLVFTTVADAKRYGMDGLFIPLDDLLEKHGQNILQAIREEGIEEDMRALDGKIYFFPKISLQHPEPFIVRQDWLEKYNMKPPETLEDIYQMLKTFKKEDPAGNEQTIPFGSMMYNDPSICYLNAFYRAFTVDQDFILKKDRIEDKIFYTPQKIFTWNIKDTITRIGEISVNIDESDPAKLANCIAMFLKCYNNF